MVLLCVGEYMYTRMYTFSEFIDNTNGKKHKYIRVMYSKSYVNQLWMRLIHYCENAIKSITFFYGTPINIAILTKCKIYV